MKPWTVCVLVAAVALSVVACDEDAGNAPSPPTAAATRVAAAEPENQSPTPTPAPTPAPTPVEPTPTEPPPTQTQVPAPRTYTVKAGDVCWRIAEVHGVTTGELMEANPRIDADCRNLRVGWEIVIPGGVAAAAGSPTSEAASTLTPEATRPSTPEATPTSTPDSTSQPAQRSASTPVATPTPEGYWHDHCARNRVSGGCDRRYRPSYYARHYHPPSYPRHSQGEHEID